MTLILSGTDGLSDVDGSAATPAIRGTDANTGIFFPAADTIAFSEGGTEAMRIDSSGNVGIGTASPAKKLSVVNATDATTVGTNSVMTVQAGSSINSVAEIGFSYGSWGGTNPIASLGYQITSNAGVGSGALTFSTRSVTTDTAPSERMRIDSSGNVGIGLIPTGDTLLEIYGANSATTYKNVNTGTGSSDGFYVGMAKSSGTDGYVYNRESANVIFGTANAERMRIDTSGNLLVGTTSNYVGETNFVESKNGYVFAANNTGSANNRNWLMSPNTSAAGTLDFIPSATNTGWANASYAMTLTSAGNLTILGATATKASGTTWANPSDQRLKDNIRDYTKGSTELMQVRVREWEYNGKGGTTEGMKGLGVIADEVMTVLPNTVEDYDAKLNADDEETTAIKKFDATEITWLLVKTVQEQQALITQLQADVAALKGTP